MDRLSEMEAFIAVVDQGGFTEAAKKLGLSKSAVSKHVATLERRLGARLLNRTTRRVSPTEIGRAYYDKTIQVIADAIDADEMVTAMQASPRGALRISVPVSFGIRHVSGAVGTFLKRYPDVSINMVMDDRYVEVVSEGYDMAIRIGRLSDSTMRARRLSEARMAIVAAPGYLKAHGTPAALEDLSAHNLLHYSNLSTGNFWRIHTPAGEERQVRVSGRLTVNNGDTLLHAAEAGLGIAMLPTFILCDGVSSGRLVEILPDRQTETVGIFAVYPPGRYTQPKVRAF
ncbi:MAG: LysR family transcriptional regulator, partial [Paracoccaceae bacterium]